MSKKKSERDYLKKHPLCGVCMRDGKYVKATNVALRNGCIMESRCNEHHE